MRKLIILSNNETASCLLQEAAEYISIPENVFGCSARTFSAAASQCAGSETIILCDIWNSQAAVQAMEWMNSQKGLILSGMNLAMVIAAVTFMDALDTLQELKKTLTAEAAGSVKGIII